MDVPAVVTQPVERRVSRNGALLVASFGALLAFLDATIVNVAFPSIRVSFPGSSIETLSWVLTAYNIVFAALLVAAGRFADLFGRRRLFTSGIVLFTIASGLCAVAPSVSLLVAARAVQAVGAALLVPASLALVVEAFPANQRARAVGLWGAAAAAAAGLGPPLGGALVEIYNWRLAFRSTCRSAWLRSPSGGVCWSRAGRPDGGRSRTCAARCCRRRASRLRRS